MPVDLEPGKIEPGNQTVLSGVVKATVWLVSAVSVVSIACGGDNAAQPLAPTATPGRGVAAAPALLPTATAASNLAPAITPTVEPSASTPATPAPIAAVVPTRAAQAPATAGAAPAPDATPTRAARPAPVTVRLTLETGDRTFMPHQVHGNFDDTVVLTLRGSNERHSFTAPYAGVDVVVERGSSAEVRFVMPPRRGPDGSASYEEGIFPFYCRFHGTPTSGMHGFLIFH